MRAALLLRMRAALLLRMRAALLLRMRAEYLTGICQQSNIKKYGVNAQIKND